MEWNPALAGVVAYKFLLVFQEDRFFYYDEWIMWFFPWRGDFSFAEICDGSCDESAERNEFFQLRQGVDMIESLVDDFSVLPWYQKIVPLLFAEGDDIFPQRA